MRTLSDPAGLAPHPAGSIPRAARVLVMALLQAAILGWLYRANWADNFGMVMGDVYDNTIEVAVLEHWYNVLRGLAHWSLTNYFYPYSQTLGYNDGYLLYGLLYAPIRAAGADPFLAATLVHMAMKVACFQFFYLFARAVLRLPFAYALAGAAIFELSNNLAVHTMHAQLLTVALAPLCATLLYFAVTALLARQPRRLLGFGAGFALAYGAWALTSFYMLWFFSLFMAILLSVLALLHRRALRAALRQLDRATIAAALACLLILAASLLPFLWVYLAKARETGMHQFGNARDYALAPFDILNIGPGNYLFGPMLPFLNDTIGFPINFSEHQMGITPGLVLAFLVACIALWRRPRASLAAAIAIAAVAMWALALVVNGQTAWGAVFNLVPGAKAIRVVSRCMIFLTLPVLSVALAGVVSATTGRSRWLHLLAAAGCAFVIAEQLNRVGYIAIDRQAVTANLARIKAPSGCRAFVAHDARPLGPGQGPVDQVYRHNVDAMLISELINLPTINGFSSFNPPDWDLANPQLPDYAARANRYAMRHGIDRLCHLQLATMKWESAP